jgi:hypothetical protein
MARENAMARGRRLVAEGRLVVARVDDVQVRAVCRGDSGQVHEVGYDPDAGWHCDCEARTRCGHLYALQLVVLAPGGSFEYVADRLTGALR